MDFDDLILQLQALKGRSASEQLALLDTALEAGAEVSAESLIVAAYIAGVEDALTGTAGRPEYDLRRLEFSQRVLNSLSDTGRAIGAAALQDVLSQAREDQ